MRKTVVAALMAAVAAVWLDTGVAGADRTRIFVTFVSHNEESISNPPCAPVLTDSNRFHANRAAVLAAAQVVWDKRATWDFQSEYEFLLRLADWETDEERDRTSGMNLVQYLNTFAPGHIQVDAHSHEQRGYNYADVAYLLSRFNVPPNGVVGGFIINPVQSETWTRLRSPLKGRKYPAYTWEPKMLWGGGSAGHTSDSNASGLWRPKAANEFEVDDPNQQLSVVGNYPGMDEPIDAAPVQLLLDKLRANQLQPGRMYTATIMIPQCDLDADATLLPKIGTFIDRFQPDVQNGDLVWATLSEMTRVWKSDYESQPLVAHFSEASPTARRN